MRSAGSSRNQLDEAHIQPVSLFFLEAGLAALALKPSSGPVHKHVSRVIPISGYLGNAGFVPEAFHADRAIGVDIPPLLPVLP